MLGKRILVVDDDADLLHLVTLVFAMAGAHVYAAADGREGLRQFYIQRPDLVLLDVKLPRSDGRQICHEIRQASDVPIIMLTALEQDRDGSHVLDWGADDYVIKPFSLDVLMERVRTLLRQETRLPKGGQVHDLQR
jgi:DNA-binding response OmpR family regulator